MSLRNLPEQFANGCDISASRIERNLDALLNALNSVADKHRASRLVKTQIVLGFQPLLNVAAGTLPFMGAYNNAAQAASPLEPPATFQNTWRNKACPLNDLIVPELGSGDQYSWETSWTTNQPTLLHSVSLVMVTDSDFTNTFTYGVAPPTGKVAGQSSDDWALQVIIDSPLQTELRLNTTVEQVITTKAAVPFQLSYFAPLPAWDTAQPPHPTGIPQGLHVQFASMSYIPAGSRVRLVLTVPQYPLANASSWSTDPWTKQSITATVTLLEGK